MKDINCKRLVWVNVNVDVPLEFEGKLDDWHDEFIKFMKEKGIQEHSGASIDESKAEIICDVCGDNQMPHKMNVQDDDDEVLCDRCMNNKPEPDDFDGFDEDSDQGGRGDR